MKAEQAAAELRRNGFSVPTLTPDEHRFARFAAEVTTHLGGDLTPHHVAHVAAALRHSGLLPDEGSYPKVLYSRRPEAGRFDGESRIINHLIIAYDKRHEYWSCQVIDGEQASRLGEGWVDNIVELPSERPWSEK